MKSKEITGERVETVRTPLGRTTADVLRSEGNISVKVGTGSHTTRSSVSPRERVQSRPSSLERTIRVALNPSTGGHDFPPCATNRAVAETVDASPDELSFRSPELIGNSRATRFWIQPRFLLRFRFRPRDPLAVENRKETGTGEPEFGRKKRQADPE